MCVCFSDSGGGDWGAGGRGGFLVSCCWIVSPESLVIWSQMSIVGRPGHLQQSEYTVGEQGGIEYELCPRCWQTRGNRANLLSTLLNYWR